MRIIGLLVGLAFSTSAFAEPHVIDSVRIGEWTVTHMGDTGFYLCTMSRRTFDGEQSFNIAGDVSETGKRNASVFAFQIENPTWNFKRRDTRSGYIKNYDLPKQFPLHLEGATQRIMFPVSRELIDEMRSSKKLLLALEHVDIELKDLYDPLTSLLDCAN